VKRLTKLFTERKDAASPNQLLHPTRNSEPLCSVPSLAGEHSVGFSRDGNTGDTARQNKADQGAMKSWNETIRQEDELDMS